MSFSKHTLIICSLLVAFLLGAGVVTYFVIIKNKTAVTEETRRIFADSKDGVIYTDIFGNSVSLEQFLGKVIVVTTWASWSPFSSDDLQALSILAKDYKNQEIVFLAINRKETREQAQRYVATLPEFTDIILVIDQEDHFYNSVGGYAMPETVVFDRKGIVTEHVRGIIDVTVLREVIKNTLTTD